MIKEILKKLTKVRTALPNLWAFFIKNIMEAFKDCSTHENNVDLLILEKLEEVDLISITTNNEEDFNIIWLNKKEALKLAYSIISMVSEL